MDAAASKKRRQSEAEAQQKVAEAAASIRKPARNRPAQKNKLSKTKGAKVVKVPKGMELQEYLKQQEQPSPGEGDQQSSSSSEESSTSSADT